MFMIASIATQQYELYAVAATLEYVRLLEARRSSSAVAEMSNEYDPYSSWTLAFVLRIYGLIEKHSVWP